MIYHPRRFYSVRCYDCTIHHLIDMIGMFKIIIIIIIPVVVVVVVVVVVRVRVVSNVT